MKRFLVQISIFSFIALALYLLALSLANGYTDPFYIRFTTPKQQSFILGTSRAAQGLQPTIFKNILGEDVYNYAFTVEHSPFGEVYLKSIKRKHNQKVGGTFIIAVDPWSISTWSDTPDDPSTYRENKLCVANTTIVDMDPNFLYLYKNLNGQYKNLLIPGGASTFLHQNGWLEVIDLPMDSTSVAKRTASKIQEYREQKLPKTKLSAYRLSYLLKTINYLKQYGNVYLVRLPVQADMLDLEKELMPDFDEVISEAINNSDGYLDLTPYLALQQHGTATPYMFTDGNHLYKPSGEQVSTLVAKWVKEQNNK